MNTMTPEIIDYTCDFSNALIAQGKDNNFLVLYKRETPMRRIDGKFASYEIEYRSLSTHCNNDCDEAYACVLYSELNFYQYDEIRSLIRKLQEDKEVDLFEQFLIY